MLATTAGYGQRPALDSIPRLDSIQTLEDLDGLARATSQSEFVPRTPVLPKLAALSYSDYIAIEYQHDRATWWGGQSPFWIETFHQGFVQRENVELFVAEGGVNRRIPFSTADFQYKDSVLDPDSLGGAGHAGIKIAGRFPAGATQEILTFLGSSYFRARSENTVYGSSARGLAVDIGIDRDEEFPFFRAFWVREPDVAPEKDAAAEEATDPTITVLALMDSRRVTGAYRFVLTPGTAETRLSVEARLHFRQHSVEAERTLPRIEKLGIAPLTGMWSWGDGLPGPPLDRRPGVHDCDGLLVRGKDNDWTWRALSRPPYPSVTSIDVDELAGFGLIQRNTAFLHFDDHNAMYHLRPSVFVTPRGQWPPGRIELLEIPGEHEGIDNIGAYWVPDRIPEPGKSLHLSYEVGFFAGDHAEETNVARATAFTVDRQEDMVVMQIRFAGSVLSELADDAKLDVRLATIRGKVVSHSTRKTETGDWLLDLLLEPTEEAPMELSATITREGQPLSERFMYLVPHLRPTFVYPDVYTR